MEFISRHIQCDKTTVDRVIYALDATGFARVKGFFNEESVSVMNDAIDKHISAFKDKNGYIPTKYLFLDLHPLFMDVMSSEMIMEVCAATQGPWFRFDHAIGLQQPGMIERADGVFVKQDEKNGNLHGGAFASQGSCFYSNINERPFIGQLVAGIVLKKQLPEDGGFCYIPGSHKHGNKMPGSKVLTEMFNGDFPHDLLHIPHLESGDLVLFTESTVHGMAPWSNTERIRRNLYYKYSPGFLAWRAYDEISPYKDLAKTELQKKLLRPPFVSQYATSDSTESGYLVGSNQFRSATYESRFSPPEKRKSLKPKSLLKKGKRMAKKILKA